MKWTWFTRLLLFAIVLNSHLSLSAQNVILTTQAEVDAFTGTKINGFLKINYKLSRINLNKVFRLPYRYFPIF